MICPKCRRWVKSSVNCCTKCGARLNVSPASRKRKRLNIVLGIAAGWLAVILVLTLWRIRNGEMARIMLDRGNLESAVRICNTFPTDMKTKDSKAVVSAACDKMTALAEDYASGASQAEASAVYSALDRYRLETPEAEGVYQDALALVSEVEQSRECYARGMQALSDGTPEDAYAYFRQISPHDTLNTSAANEAVWVGSVTDKLDTILREMADQGQFNELSERLAGFRTLSEDSPAMQEKLDALEKTYSLRWYQDAQKENRFFGASGTFALAECCGDRAEECKSSAKQAFFEYIWKLTGSEDSTQCASAAEILLDHESELNGYGVNPEILLNDAIQAWTDAEKQRFTGYINSRRRSAALPGIVHSAAIDAVADAAAVRAAEEPSMKEITEKLDARKIAYSNAAFTVKKSAEISALYDGGDFGMADWAEEIGIGLYFNRTTRRFHVCLIEIAK